MKVWRFVLLALFLAPTCRAAATPATLMPQISIARFRGNRLAALSYTFDDGTLGQYKVAAPLLEKYGFRGTFFVIPGRIADSTVSKAYVDSKGFPHAAVASWQDWRKLAAKGFEIGNHTLDHKKLTGLSDEQARRQVMEAQRLIAEKVGRVPVSFAYPGNAHNPRVEKIVHQYDPFARDYQSGLGGINRAILERGWKVVMIHAVAEVGYHPLSAAALAKNLQYVSGLTNKVWVDTFGNVSRYIRERDTAHLIVQERGTHRLVFTVTCPLDPHVFDAPLTLVVETGTKQPTAVTVRRKGGPSPRIVGERDGIILVDTSPGSNPIALTWQ